MKNFILKETSVWRLVGKFKENNILSNGYFDFSKVPQLRVNAGMLLKQYRQKANLTQKQVAKLLNYSRHDISNWELNISASPFNVLLKIASLSNISKEQIIKDIEKYNLTFSTRTKPFFLPFNVDQFYIDQFENVFPQHGRKIYSYLDKEAKSVKIINNFLNTFLEYEKEIKLRLPLTKVVQIWHNNKIDLIAPISILLLTEGAFNNYYKPGFIFLNNSKILHDILVDCIFYQFGILPTSYFIERKRLPKNSIYITEYIIKSHKILVESVINRVRNIKTAPHDNQSIESYYKELQPTLDFILNKSNEEKLIAFKLFLATEGSIYITTRFGYTYPVFDIGSTHPKIVTFLEKLTSNIGLKFKRQKSKKTWSGLKGIRARGLSTALKILKLDSFIPNVKISSKSRYFNGFEKKDLLLAILEFHKKQETNKELFNISAGKANEEILKLLKNKAFKSSSFYIKYFSKKKKVKKWL